MDSTIQLRSLESLADAKNYNRWVSDLALPYLGADPLEIGSGLGYFAQGWLDSGAPRITVSELESSGTLRLRSTFADDPRVEVREIDITDPPADLRRFTSVVAVNVLEHVRNDGLALAAASRLVVRGGAVIVFVPAHPFAMSSFDRSIGHFRRYTARRLRETFETAGIPVEGMRYINAPGLVAWLVGMKLLRRTPTDRRLLLAYDRFVVPIVRRIDQRVSLPFGQSLFAVGRR